MRTLLLGIKRQKTGKRVRKRERKREMWEFRRFWFSLEVMPRQISPADSSVLITRVHDRVAQRAFTWLSSIAPFSLAPALVKRERSRTVRNFHHLSCSCFFSAGTSYWDEKLRTGMNNCRCGYRALDCYFWLPSYSEPVSFQHPGGKIMEKCLCFSIIFIFFFLLVWIINALNYQKLFIPNSYWFKKLTLNLFIFVIYFLNDKQFMMDLDFFLIPIFI